MAERIYTRHKEAELIALEESSFKSEEELQRLVASHPYVLDGEQMRPGKPLRWMLITGEMGVAEHEGEGATWSDDLLLVDQDAVPTLVEVKRGDSTDLRRKVAGQLLEYAAHAKNGWSAAVLRLAHEKTAELRGSDPDAELTGLLPGKKKPGAQAFFERVAANLDDGKMRLLFVADTIPDSLKAIVSFLNHNMETVEVLAVEIKRFGDDEVVAYAPRIYGQTPKPPVPPPNGKLTCESFLDAFDNPDVRRVAERLLDASKNAGAQLSWGTQGVSIRVECAGFRYLVSVAWLNTPSIDGFGRFGTRYFTFGEEIGTGYGGNQPSAGLRTALVEWANSFENQLSSWPVNKTPNGWIVPYHAAVQNADELVDRLANVIRRLRELK